MEKSLWVKTNAVKAKDKKKLTPYFPLAGMLSHFPGIRASVHRVVIPDHKCHSVTKLCRATGSFLNINVSFLTGLESTKMLWLNRQVFKLRTLDRPKRVLVIFL